jgi:hypothetical protein
MAEFSSSFIDSMDNHIPIIYGENGAPSLEKTTDPRVDLFFKLVRDLPDEELTIKINNCFTNSSISKEEMIVDLFVLCFQTRNCRGGKGERDLFRKFFTELFFKYPNTSTRLFPLILHFGFGKDLISLCENSLVNKSKDRRYHLLYNQLLQFCCQKLMFEYSSLKETQDKGIDPIPISLLAKWCPSNEKHLLTKKLAYAMFPRSLNKSQNNHAFREYRKVRTFLNKHLDVTEIKMCSNSWDKINPTSVSSLCLQKKMKALINESLKSNPLEQEMDTGNRFPDDLVRVACRKNFRKALLEQNIKKLNGKQLFPHEIVKRLMSDSKSVSSMEIEILQSQWGSIKDNLREQLKQESFESGNSSTSVNLGKLIPLSDVSFSMNGIPMEVSIALGILVSELTHPQLANRILTFDTNPSWIQLNGSDSLSTKVNQVMNSPWGGSTDFRQALHLILNVCESSKLNPKEIPNLIVFSDMQFDEADDSQTPWETHYEQLVREFGEAGTRVCGQPWPVPNIIFWNLRGDTPGVPTNSDEPGVTMMSGFSPSLLKHILEGEEFQGVDSESFKSNPYDKLRKVLDDSQYDPIREMLSLSSEGDLDKYHFITPKVTGAAEEK